MVHGVKSNRRYISHLLPFGISFFSFFFFFNDTATTEIYTLSLHDALPICPLWKFADYRMDQPGKGQFPFLDSGNRRSDRKLSRSEEHTSELQSHSDLVCRLLLEKKKNLITSL